MVDGSIQHDQPHSGHFVAATGRQDARMLLGESPCCSVRPPWVRRPGLGLGNGKGHENDPTALYMQFRVSCLGFQDLGVRFSAFEGCVA